MNLPSIKIPQLLSLSIAENSRQRKALSLFLYLKTFDVKGSGKLSYYSFIDQACLALNVHERTIRNWLKLAIEFNLVERNNPENNSFGGVYHLISWQDLSSMFACHSNRFYYIKHESIKFKFEYVLERYAIQEKQQQCKYAAKAKYEHSVVKEEVENVASELGIKNSLSDLKNCQQYDFLTARTRLTEDQRFFIHIANPDTNVGYKRFAEIFGYNSRGGFAYKKRILKKHGLIDVQPRQFTITEEFGQLLTTKNSRETKLGQVNYFRPKKALVLTLCDQISPNPQTQWRQTPSMHTEKI